MDDDLQKIAAAARQSLHVIGSDDLRKKLVAAGAFPNAAAVDRFFAPSVRRWARDASRPQREFKVGERDLRALLTMLGARDEEIDFAIRFGPLAPVVWRDVRRRMPRECFDATALREMACRVTLQEFEGGIDDDSADAILDEIRSRIAETST